MRGSRDKPKVGLFLLTAEWFQTIGAHEGSFANLASELDQDAARIEAALGADLDIENPGVLSTVAQVHAAIARFRQEAVEAIIVCQITWGEDRLVIRIAQEMAQMPLLLWCYTPSASLASQLSMPEMFRASGPVGTLQASGPLKRLGKRFGFAFGPCDDERAIKAIVAFARAAQTAAKLKRARIGVLPYRCDQMTGTHVDEFRLRQEIGPECKYVSVLDYRDICEQVMAQQVDAFVTELERAYAISDSVTSAGLFKAARASLGLAKVAQCYDLDAIAIEDISEELHRVMGLRPCLAVPALFERAVVSMEAEVGGAVALLMLRWLTQKSPMYTEILAVDTRENGVLIGHAGIHDAAHLAASDSDILIEPDGEYVESEPDSAWMRFRAKPGSVTLLSVFCDVERFKLVIASGEALGGPPKLLGSPHAYVKLATPVAEFFERTIRTGMTQHWALVHDEVVQELVALADILGLDRVLV